MLYGVDKMKLRMVFIMLSLAVLPVTSAFANICQELTKEKAEKAEGFLKTQTEVLYFCAFCKTKPETLLLKDVSVRKEAQPKADKSTAFNVLINGKPVNTAFVYVKKDGKQENLAFLINCETLGQDRFFTEDSYYPFLSKEEIVNKVADVQKNCGAGVENYAKAQQVTACIKKEVLKQMRIAFHEDDYRKAEEAFLQAEKAEYNFYREYFNSNKYCTPKCGIIATYMPYVRLEGWLLDILHNLISLNANRGY